MPELTLDDLVRNRTMSTEIADTLRAAVRARRSYLVIALPRFAGKSTVGAAMMAEADGAPIRTLGQDGDDVDALARDAKGGYLYVPEIARRPVAPGYVWGEPVRRAFRAIARGTALSTALHADAIDDALAIVQENGVPDEDLARLDLVVHIRSLGADVQFPDRRVVANVGEMDAVRDRVPRTRPLHHWDEASDRFITLAEPKRFKR